MAFDPFDSFDPIDSTDPTNDDGNALGTLDDWTVESDQLPNAGIDYSPVLPPHQLQSMIDIKAGATPATPTAPTIPAKALPKKPIPRKPQIPKEALDAFKTINQFNQIMNVGPLGDIAQRLAQQQVQQQAQQKQQTNAIIQKALGNTQQFNKPPISPEATFGSRYQSGINKIPSPAQRAKLTNNVKSIRAETPTEQNISSLAASAEPSTIRGALNRGALESEQFIRQNYAGLSYLADDLWNAIGKQAEMAFAPSESQRTIADWSRESTVFRDIGDWLAGKSQEQAAALASAQLHMNPDQSPLNQSIEFARSQLGPALNLMVMRNPTLAFGLQKMAQARAEGITDPKELATRGIVGGIEGKVFHRISQQPFGLGRVATQFVAGGAQAPIESMITGQPYNAGDVVKGGLGNVGLDLAMGAGAGNVGRPLIPSIENIRQGLIDRGIAKPINNRAIKPAEATLPDINNTPEIARTDGMNEGGEIIPITSPRPRLRDLIAQRDIERATEQQQPLNPSLQRMVDNLGPQANRIMAAAKESIYSPNPAREAIYDDAWDKIRQAEQGELQRNTTTEGGVEYPIPPKPPEGPTHTAQGTDISSLGPSPFAGEEPGKYPLTENILAKARERAASRAGEPVDEVTGLPTSGTKLFSNPMFDTEQWKKLGTDVKDLAKSWYYSGLNKTIAEKFPNKMSPEQAMGMLQNKQYGIKAEEYKGSGLDELLANKAVTGESVTKKELLDTIQKNQLNVGEVFKGAPREQKGPPPNPELDAKIAAKRIELDSIRQQTEEADRAYNDLLTRTTSGTDTTTPEEAARITMEYFKAKEARNKVHDELAALTEARDPYGERMRRAEENDDLDTRYEGWNALKGGEPGSYREMLLTLPKRKTGGEYARDYNNYSQELHAKYGDGWRNKATQQELDEANRLSKLSETPDNVNFYSSHWSEPNILAHMRFDEGRDADGRKVLRVQEIQSDWHQQGREKGYIDPEAVQQKFGSVPDAPFKNTWHELAMKRLIRYAADNGFERIVWPEGKAQIDLYEDSIRQNVDKIEWQSDLDGIHLFPVKDGEYKQSFQFQNLTPERVSELVGPTIAKKITDNIQDHMGSGTIEGDDLSIGGQVHKLLYDQKLPQFARDVAKKFGGEYGKTTTEGDKYIPGSTSSREEADLIAQGDPRTVTQQQPAHYLDIPESLVNTARAEGFKLYSNPFADPEAWKKLGGDVADFFRKRVRPNEDKLKALDRAPNVGVRSSNIEATGVRDFIRANPSASPEEIAKYAESQTPNIRVKTLPLELSPVDKSARYNSNPREIRFIWDDSPADFRYPLHYGQERNVIASVMAEDLSTTDGLKGTAIAESQSDWFQGKGPKNVDAPFKNDWLPRTLAYMISEAKENGKDGILLPKTEDQVYRIQKWDNLRDEEALKELEERRGPVLKRYLQTLPQEAAKFAKMNGSQLETKQVVVWPSSGRTVEDYYWLPINKEGQEQSTTQPIEATSNAGIGGTQLSANPMFDPQMWKATFKGLSNWIQSAKPRETPVDPNDPNIEVDKDLTQDQADARNIIDESVQEGLTPAHQKMNDAYTAFQDTKKARTEARNRANLLEKLLTNKYLDPTKRAELEAELAQAKLDRDSTLKASQEARKSFQRSQGPVIEEQRAQAKSVANQRLKFPESSYAVSPNEPLHIEQVLGIPLAESFYSAAKDAAVAAGVVLDPDATVTDQMLDMARNGSVPLMQFNDILEKNGLSMDEFLDQVDRTASIAGKILNLPSQIARVLNQLATTNPELKKILNARLPKMQQLNQMYRERSNWDRLGNIYQGALVSSVGTAMRNLNSAQMMVGLDSIGQVFDSFVQQGIGGARDNTGKLSPVTAIKPFINIYGEMINSLRSGSFKSNVGKVSRTVDALSEAFPKEVNFKLFGILDSDLETLEKGTDTLSNWRDQVNKLPDSDSRKAKLSAAIDAAQARYEKTQGLLTKGLVGTEKVLHYMNWANRGQETLMRRAIFEGKLRRYAQEAGVDVDGLVEQGKAGEIPVEIVTRAADEALRLTFGKRAERGSPEWGLQQFIRGKSGARGAAFKLGVLPFPNFLINNYLKYQYEHSPLGLLSGFGAKEKANIAKGDYSVFWKPIIGAAIFGMASQMRKDHYDEQNSQIGPQEEGYLEKVPRTAFGWMTPFKGGEKWYEVKVGGKNIDLRFTPFGPAFLAADLLERNRRGLGAVEAKDLIDSLGMGMKGVDQQGEIIGNAIKGINDSAARLKTSQLAGQFFGSVAAGFLSPLQQISDLALFWNKQEQLQRNLNLGVSEDEGLKGEAKTFGLSALQQVQNKIPYLKQSLPENALPTKAQTPIRYDPVLRQFPGVQIGEPKNFAQQEFDTLGITNKDVAPHIDNPKVNAIIDREMGKMVEPALENLGNDPNWKTISAEQRREILIDYIFPQFYDAVKESAMAQIPESVVKAAVLSAFTKEQLNVENRRRKIMGQKPIEEETKSNMKNVKSQPPVATPNASPITKSQPTP